MKPKNQIIVKKNEYLNKPHQTIHIEGKLNFIQHKCWNILALNAVKNNLRVGNQEHQMSLTDLYKDLEYEAENDIYLTKLLEAITRINISGDVFREDGSKFWIAFNLFAQCIVEKGICYYEYPSFVAELLAQPKRYIRVLMKLQNRFNGGYGLKLYEFLKTKYIEKQKRGTSGDITLEIFRQLMGLENSKYSEFKILKRDLIILAIKEINEKTDIFVELELVKNRQKVIALKFQITENPNKDKNLKQLEIANLSELQIDSKAEDLKTKLESLGFGEAQTRELLNDPDRSKVLDCADYVSLKLQKEIETGKTKNKIESPTGYFFRIFNAYEDIDFSGLEDWRIQQQQKQSELNQQMHDQTQQEIEEAQDKIKQERDKKLIQEFKESNSEIFEKICEDYLEELEKKNKIIFNRVLKKSTELNQTLIETVKDYSMTSSEIDLRILEKIETVNS